MRCTFDDIAEDEQSTSKVPADRTPEAGCDETTMSAPSGEAPTALDRRRFHFGGGRSWRHLRQLSAVAGGRRRDTRDLRHDRLRRLRVIAWSLVGVVCLQVAHMYRPLTADSIYTLPSNAVDVVALVCGLAGLWLVPGLWLSAIVVRIGAGLPAWVATRIATTLTWYALLGPLIHQLGRGARVTPDGLLLATTAVTAVVVVGAAAGMVWWPASPWLRTLIPGAIGAAGAQTSIWLYKRTRSTGMNYEHIDRLNWLFVLLAAVFVAMATLVRPTLPPRRTFRNVQMVAFSFLLITVAAAVMLTATARWSPLQRMPSSFGIEQVPAPIDVDVAFRLTAVGPDGAQSINDAEFVVSDEVGRVVPALLQVQLGDGAHSPELFVVLSQDTQPVLCRLGGPAKLTVRDEVSGASVQALIPDGWCPVT